MTQNWNARHETEQSLLRPKAESQLNCTCWLAFTRVIQHDFFFKRVVANCAAITQMQKYSYNVLFWKEHILKSQMPIVWNLHLNLRPGGKTQDYTASLSNAKDTPISLLQVTQQYYVLTWKVFLLCTKDTVSGVQGQEAARVKSCVFAKQPTLMIWPTVSDQLLSNTKTLIYLAIQSRCLVLSATSIC